MEQNQDSHQSGKAGQLIPIGLTVVIFLIIFWRIPFNEFVLAISKARLAPFLALMGCFSICFFLMDTFVLSKMIRWFHGPLDFRTLLPVRAVTYVVSIINTQLAQVALALYFHRRFQTPLAEITSTVAMLILLEVTNLISFATVGLIAFPGGAPLVLITLPLGLGCFWIFITQVARGGLGVIGEKIGGHTLLKTFRAVRFKQGLIVLALKGSVFLLSLFVHKYALTLFGMDIPLFRLLTFLPPRFHDRGASGDGGASGHLPGGMDILFQGLCPRSGSPRLQPRLPSDLHAGERDDRLVVHAESVCGFIRKKEADYLKASLR